MQRVFPTPAEVFFHTKTLFYRRPFFGAFGRIAGKSLALPQQFPPSLLQGNALVGEALLDGYFDFNGEMHEVEERDWRFKQASEHWLNTLHSFEWLHDLKASNKEEAREAAAAMTLDWCKKHRSWRKQAWCAKVTSRRISAWLSLFDFITAKMQPEQKRLFLTSLWSQVRFLNKAYPQDLIGAERVIVSKALMLADLCFNRQTESAFKGWRLLERELRRSILPDGGLSQRSTKLTLETLHHLIETRAALREFGQVVPSTLDAAIKLLGRTVEALKLPDGSLANFHLMPLTTPQHIDRLLNLSGDFESMQSFPDLGLERLEAKRAVLLLSTGKIHKPAFNRHLHSNPLAFEFALGKQKLIVNCGSHLNQKKFGLSERMTAAHSTILVNEKNAHPIKKIWAGSNWALSANSQDEVKVQSSTDNGLQTLSASHGFYKSENSAEVTRQLQLEQDGEMLTGKDLIRARMSVEACIRFHLHPDVEPRQNGQTIFLRLPSGRSWRFDCSPDARVGIEDSIYLEVTKFRTTKQIVVRSQSTQITNDISVDWRFSREGRAARQSL